MDSLAIRASVAAIAVPQVADSAHWGKVIPPRQGEGVRWNDGDRSDWSLYCDEHQEIMTISPPITW